MIVAKAVSKALKKGGSKKKGMLGKVASKLKKKAASGAMGQARKAGAQRGRAKAGMAATLRSTAPGRPMRTREEAFKTTKARFGRYNEDEGGRR